MIHLVRSGFAWHAVDGLGDLEVMFVPTPFSERTPQSLCESGLAAAAADDFGNGQVHGAENIDQFHQGARKVACRNGARVGEQLHIEALVQQRLQR